MGCWMRPELIIFDCDGVLIDSEFVASRVVAENLSRVGWEMDAAAAMRLFMGMSILDMEPVIEGRLRRHLPEGWRAGLAAELAAALAAEAEEIPGARNMLERVEGMGIAWRVASNSSDEEMAIKFGRTGMAGLVKGKIFAAMRVGRPKPAPDVYLAAAASAGVAAGDCIVVEDSVLGVEGAVAAGMAVYGFDRHGDGRHLVAAGAKTVFRELDALFGVIG
jgi:HAD superfamily hydrolase (TIGR01509 family)